MAKYDEYLRQYSAELRAARQYETIVREIQDERQQVLALQQLIQSERNTLAQLDQAFEAQKTEQGYASEILRATLSSEQMAAQLAAGTRAAQGAAMRVPKSVVDAVEAAKQASNAGELTAAGANRAGTLAIAALGSRDRPMTQQAADATLAYLEALPNMPTQTLRLAQRAAAQVADRPTRGPGAAPLTPEQAAQEAGRERALEAVFHSSKQGFAGGFDGEAVARRRRSTVAPADTSFATAEDALDNYLAMLDDGFADAAELAALTGADADQAERDFRFAKGVYAEAKAQGAYKNAQRKFFEQSYLSQQRRVTQLERELEAATPDVRRSVTEEARRRVLQERGLDPDDKYLKFRGTPKYDYLRAADRIFESVEDVVAATEEQKQVAQLLKMYESQGIDWRLDDLADQLAKIPGLEGEALAEAVGFGLALDRQVREGRKPPDQAKLQREEAERVRRQEQQEDELERQARQDIEDAKQARDAEADRIENMRRIYQQARAAGMSEVEARLAADPTYVPPAEVAAELGRVDEDVAALDTLQLRGELADFEEVEEVEAAATDNAVEAEEETEEERNARLLEKYTKAE